MEYRVALPRWRPLDLVLLALLLLVGASSGVPRRLAADTALPPGFGESVVALGLSAPTAMTFAPDGRLFVCEQQGALRVVKNGQLAPQPFLTVNADDEGERGLLGVAVDPNFETDPYLYLYYTVDELPRHNRVSRFTANGDVVVPDSEVVLLDLPELSAASNHNGGALHFGPDGTLFVAVGENGQPTLAPLLDSPFGKLLRLNKDGSVPPDNPFLAETTGVNQYIWARGLRNPFTFAFQPGTSQLFINDVGQNKWEEINQGVAGANYGWPSTEGPTSKPGINAPVFAYKHNDTVFGGCAISGGAFYNPVTPRFPAEWVGRYFFADFCGGWIATVDSAAPGAGASLFATGLSFPVDLHLGPDGALYYLQRGDGAVHRIDYLVDAPPIITLQPADRLASENSPASFQVSASGTPELTYQWERDNVPIPGAVDPIYTLFPAALTDSGAQFRCVVTNAFGQDTSLKATLTVTENTPPTPTIELPAEGLLYSGGDTFTYLGSAADAEDGTLPASAFLWRVDFRHADHDHPFVSDTPGVTGGEFTIPTQGETAADVLYRIHLTVTDSGGLTGSTYRDVLPRTVNLTLATIPAGRDVDLDGQPTATPTTFPAVAGIQRSLSTPDSFSDGPDTYLFDSWSDGGAASHFFSTPAADTTLTALYRLQTGAPSNLQAIAASGIRANLTWADNCAVESGFSVERRVGTGTWQELGISPANTPAFSDGGLQPETSATYRVRALVSGVGTVASNQVAVATPRAGKLKVTPGKVQFGTVRGAAVKTKTLTLKNIGKGPLPVNVGGLSAPFEVSGGAGSVSLAPGAKRVVTVRFLTAPAGTASQPLVVTSDDPAKGVVNVPVTGTRKP